MSAIDVSGATVSVAAGETATVAANRQTIEQAIAQAAAALQAIIDTPQPTITSNAQAQTAVRGLQAQVKDIARAVKLLGRIVRSDFSGTD